MTEPTTEATTITTTTAVNSKSGRGGGRGGRSRSGRGRSGRGGRNNHHRHNSKRRPTTNSANGNVASIGNDSIDANSGRMGENDNDNNSDYINGRGNGRRVEGGKDEESKNRRANFTRETNNENNPNLDRSHNSHNHRSRSRAEDDVNNIADENNRYHDQADTNDHNGSTKGSSRGTGRGGRGRGGRGGRGRGRSRAGRGRSRGRVTAKRQHFSAENHDINSQSNNENKDMQKLDISLDIDEKKFDHPDDEVQHRLESNATKNDRAISNNGKSSFDPSNELLFKKGEEINMNNVTGYELSNPNPNQFESQIKESQFSPDATDDTNHSNNQNNTDKNKDSTRRNRNRGNHDRKNSKRGHKKGRGMERHSQNHNNGKEILKRNSSPSQKQQEQHQYDESSNNDFGSKDQKQSHSLSSSEAKESNNNHQVDKAIQNDILGIPINPAPSRMNSSQPKNTSEAQMRRIDSVASMMSETSEKDAKAGSVGAIDLLKNRKKSSLGPKKEKKTKKDPSTKKKKSKQSKSKKTGQQHNDEIANQRAAKAFNNAVRKCVERSDPDGLYDLLHEKRNHKFALHADVLEIVLKAFVVAAMFDEALYCCKNCTRPGTLSTIQAEKILQCLPQNLRNSSAYVAADMINALCIATEFDKPTHRTYFMRIVRGIALEFLEEATSARDRICSAPCERLVRSAVCIVDAQLRRGKKAADLVVLPGKQLGVFVPDSMETRGIQAGDAVGILPYAGPYPMSAESLDRNMIEATVTGVHPMVLRLQDKTNTNLYATLTEPVDGNVYRIDKLANRMGFNRQLSAAVAIASPLEKDMNGVTITTRCDVRRPSPELIKAITAMDENIDRVMIGGNISRKQSYSGELTSTAALCAQPVPFYTAEDSTYNCDGEVQKQDQYDEDSIRDAARLALEKYGAFEGLNASQRLAVEGAATNRLTLVQGPPGTGKTAVAIRIIQHWARLAASETFPGQNPKPILATSDSNIAVDNLVEGCANVGLKVIRLGRPEAIRPELLRYCIDRPQNDRSQNNPDGSGYGGNQGSYAYIYKEKMKALKNAQVICCTCIGSGADILDNMTFERVLVDEATQATEPAVLVPLTRLCRQLVLVGDHCQLPPTVLSTRAEEEGLGVPLFSRMVACGVPPFMLDTQYRMHPSIAMFPSDLFYGGKLLNGVSPPERRPLAGFPWPREEFPVAFVPVPLGVEIDDGVSKMNEAEAAAACDAVETLLKGGQCSTSDIAVVTPYAAQVRLIRRLTRKLVNGPPYVEVSSTDGFQGREKEAVVFSAVRSNDYGSVGFVSDWRRVNVSFTRARRGLIVIGNDLTLRRGDPDTWMPWLEWVNAHGVNMDKPGKTRGRYDAEQLRRVRGGTTAAEMLKDVLERQQQQLQKAEKQIQSAQKKSSGQIISTVDGVNYDNNQNPSGSLSKNVLEQSLQDDLALLSNVDGNWDDSDDDECNDIHNSVSAVTLTSLTSSSATKIDEPQDAWDLE